MQQVEWQERLEAEKKVGQSWEVAQKKVVVEDEKECIGLRIPEAAERDRCMRRERADMKKNRVHESLRQSRDQEREQ